MAAARVERVRIMSAEGPCSSFVRGRAAARRGFRSMFAIGFWAAAAAYGQNVPQTRFEVASVKPGGDIFSTRPDRSGGRIRWTTQLCYLIGYAYRLDFSRVSGRPCGAIYSLEAMFDPATTDDQVRLNDSVAADGTVQDAGSPRHRGSRRIRHGRRERRTQNQGSQGRR